MSPSIDKEAEAVAKTYASALMSRDFATGWGLLSDKDRAAFGSIEAFADERTLFLESARYQIVVGRPTSDPQEVAEFWQVAGTPPIDVTRARLVRLDYPALAHTTNDHQLLLIAPNQAGVWTVWVVR